MVVNVDLLDTMVLVSPQSNPTFVSSDNLYDWQGLVNLAFKTVN